MERCFVIKEQYKLIEKHPDNTGYLIYWDYQPNEYDESVGLETGTCYRMLAPYKKPTVNLVKLIINNTYNNIAEETIFSGFKWNGKTVYLTAENQRNYSTMYNLCGLDPDKFLPYTINTGSDEEGHEYVTFNNMEEIENFYLAYNEFIINTLAKCREDKDAMDYTLYEEALKEVDDIPEGTDLLTNVL